MKVKNFLDIFKDMPDDSEILGISYSADTGILEGRIDHGHNHPYANYGDATTFIAEGGVKMTAIDNIAAWIE